jgi:hypothetical protein
MRSHHAPTLHLLERFTYKDRRARNRRAIWIYEKGRPPRTSSDLRGECAEHGYFSGGDRGESESEIDFRFNSQYEVPFNRLLPALDANLHIFESLEIRQVCAEFVANLFHRSTATRKGGQELVASLIEDYRSIADDPERLFAYTAKLSAITARPIATSEVRDALLKSMAHYSTIEGKKAVYVNDLDRATKSLSAHLIDLEWSTMRPNTAESFFISDTPIISRAVDGFGTVTFGAGIRNPTAEWILPISNRMAIRIAHKRRASSNINSEELAELNQAQIYTMTRRLYGKEYSQWIDQMVQSYGGIYKFHVDVFKATGGAVREDTFDDIMASIG